jgi:septum formation protein
MKLILASSSPQRKELLSNIGYRVDITVAPDINEETMPKEKPEKLAARLALEKCRKVAVGFPDDIIIAADTVVGKGRREVVKPVNRQQAEEGFKILSGGRHSVSTGVCIKAFGKEITKTVVTKLKFKRLSQAEINILLESGEWQGRSGGYSCLGYAAAYITWLNGSYTNVVGLPLAETHQMLQGLGVQQIVTT